MGNGESNTSTRDLSVHTSRSTQDEEATPGDSGERTEEPAIGLRASTMDTDALVRTIVRANQYGFDAIVADHGDLEAGRYELIEQLGATVVKPLQGDSDVSLRNTLVAGATARSYPGVILAPVDGDEIDYGRSAATFEASEKVCVEAVPEQPDETDQSRELIVAIPAYNEAETIHSVVTEVRTQTDHVIVVDDGSDDDTAERARKAGARVIQHAENKGYGAALKTAFREAAQYDTDCLVTMDADGQHQASDIPALHDCLIDADKDIVIGSRFLEGGDTRLPRYRLFGLLVINALTNVSMGVVRSSLWVSDTQSGFRAYSSRAIESLAAEDGINNHMGASTDILYHAHGREYDIAEVPTTIDYDVDNCSTHTPLTHGLTLVQNILRTVERERPITAFGVPGFIATVFGLGFGYLTISNYLSTYTFPIGLATTSVFLMLLGILACFTAIILHSLSVHIDLGG